MEVQDLKEELIIWVGSMDKLGDKKSEKHTHVCFIFINFFTKFHYCYILPPVYIISNAVQKYTDQ